MHHHQQILHTLNGVETRALLGEEKKHRNKDAKSKLLKEAEITLHVLPSECLAMKI